MNNAPNLDSVLEVCGHKHRRIVLASLDNQQRSPSIDDLTDAIIKHNHHKPPTDLDDETVERIRTGLHHAHLPMLAKAGFIQYDSERQVVKPTAHVGRGVSDLSAILDLDPGLPATYRPA